jgi:uncharacterized protein YbjT (DUF2867 family)
MRVVIAGGHGQIALLLSELLSRAGDEPVALIRNPDHAADVEATGARPAVLDLEHATAAEVAAVLAGADAAVFAAGAGATSTAERKYTVDRDGSVLLAQAAEQAGVARFVQISTMGAGRPPAAERGEIWAAYIDAKTQAESDLCARSLDWTVLRPGRLTDGAGIGKVSLLAPPAPYGEVPRADVAAVVAALLHAPATAGQVLELISGDTPIAVAVTAI